MDIQLFSELSQDTKDYVLGKSQVCEIDKNTLISVSGIRPDSMLVLLNGAVEKSLRYADRKHVFEVIRPTQLLSAESVVVNLPSLAELKTLEDSQLLVIPASVIRDLASKHVDFCSALLAEVAYLARGYMRQINGLKLRDGTERLVAWIEMEHRRFGKRGYVNLPISKRTLAHVLGMTPENLSRSIAQLKKFGVISSGSRLEIVDPLRWETVVAISTFFEDVDEIELFRPPETAS